MKQEKARAFFTLVTQFMSNYESFAIRIDFKCGSYIEHFVTGFELTFSDELYLYHDYFSLSVKPESILSSTLENYGDSETLQVICRGLTLTIRGVDSADCKEKISSVNN